MSEPRRWKDAPDSPIGMRELLGAAKPTRALDEGSFRRGAARVAKLGVAPAAAAATISIWTKLAAAGALGLAATGAVVAVELREHQAPVPVVAPPPPPAPVQTVEPSPSSSPSAVIVTPEPPPVVMRAKPTPVVPVVPPPPEPPPPSVEPKRTSTLASELLLLEDARAYAPRDPETALARLAEHRARHPAGVLASERDLMELDLLRRTGRVQDARDRAKAWLARDPNGLHSARVREILASLEEPVPGQK